MYVDGAMTPLFSALHVLSPLFPRFGYPSRLPKSFRTEQAYAHSPLWGHCTCRLPKSFRTEQADAQSKLAQILAMKEMRRRLGPESSIQVWIWGGVGGLGQCSGWGLHAFRCDSGKVGAVLWSGAAFRCNCLRVL